MSALMLYAHGVLFHHDLPEHALVDDVGGVIDVAGPVDVQKESLADSIELAVGHPVRFDEPAQPNEEVPGERHVVPETSRASATK